MSDIAKARFFLKAKGSKLQHLETFALMLATAKSNYKEMKLRSQGNKEGISLEKKELETAIDLAVLSYLNRHAQLPPNVKDVLSVLASDAEKHQLAMSWYNA